MEVDPITNAIACVLLTVVSALILYGYVSLSKQYKNKKQAISKNNGVNGMCSSPDCIRCEKYQLVKATALLKLKELIKNQNSRDLTRILLGLSDNEIKPRQYTYQNPNVFFLPGLAAKPWWTESNVFDLEKSVLTQHVQIIKDEFQNIYTNIDHRRWLCNTTSTGQWTVFCLYNQGVRIKENCLQCPQTCDIIESLPLFMNNCLFGNALFSVLEPGTNIEEHCGPCNLRIRCHLGLTVPNDCVITVGHEKGEWTAGKCILFDDSFAHSVEHRGINEEIRVILLVDLWHPCISKKEQEALEYIF